jgi:hypothetical protein
MTCLVVSLCCLVLLGREEVASFLITFFDPEAFFVLDFPKFAC